MEDWKTSLDPLKQKWEDFQVKFKKGIKESAESGALLTFSFEFKRIKEGKEILKANFSNAGELEKECEYYEVPGTSMARFLDISDLVLGKNIRLNPERHIPRSWRMLLALLSQFPPVWVRNRIMGKVHIDYWDVTNHAKQLMWKDGTYMREGSTEIFKRKPRTEGGKRKAPWKGSRAKVLTSPLPGRLAHGMQKNAPRLWNCDQGLENKMVEKLTQADEMRQLTIEEQKERMKAKYAALKAKHGT